MAEESHGNRRNRSLRSKPSSSIFGRLFSASRRRQRETRERETRYGGTPDRFGRQHAGGFEGSRRGVAEGGHPRVGYGPEPWQDPHWYAERTDHPHGLGDYDTQGPSPMERGFHEPRIDNRGQVDRMGMGGFGGGYRGPTGQWAGQPPGPQAQRSVGRWGEIEPHRGETFQGGSRLGPGAWRRPRRGFQGAGDWQQAEAFRARERQWEPGPDWEREPAGRHWEGASRRPSTGERTTGWFRGREGVARSGPGAGPGERPGEWFGGRQERPETDEWYGGGVRSTTPRWRGQDFGNLGGPHGGRYGYERPSEAWEGRGAGGPLGSSREREGGERGRLYGSRLRGRIDHGPIRGEAVAGRGHVGSEDYRDLTRWGEGGDRRTHERYLERREEPDHFPKG